MSAEAITTPINASCQALVSSLGNSTHPLIPNLDVSGIGIIISFIISAYVCLFVAVFCYIVGLLPNNLLNDYDRLFCQAKSKPSLHRWFRALAEGVLTFSDSQVLQGVAILTAGFANMNVLTVYDWQILVYLACVTLSHFCGIQSTMQGSSRMGLYFLMHSFKLMLFLIYADCHRMSSNVHLTTLTFLRDYLYERPTLLNIRLGGMLILLVMLMVAFVPTSTQNWVLAVTRQFDREHYPSNVGNDWYALNYAMPVTCFWHKPYNSAGPKIAWLKSTINPDAPFTYIALLFTYIWKMSSLLRKRFINQEGLKKRYDDTDLTRRPWFKDMPLAILSRQAKNTAFRIDEFRRAGMGSHLHNKSPTRLQFWWLSFWFRVILITYATSLALFDFLSSFIASLWALGLLLIWGSLEVANVRNKALPNVHALENSWEFGQILPMLLLVGPVIAVMNHFLRDHDLNNSQELRDIAAAVQDKRTHDKIEAQRKSVAVSKSSSPPAQRPNHHAAPPLPPQRLTIPSSATSSQQPHDSLSPSRSPPRLRLRDFGSLGDLVASSSPVRPPVASHGEAVTQEPRSNRRSTTLPACVFPPSPPSPPPPHHRDPSVEPHHETRSKETTAHLPRRLLAYFLTLAKDEEPDLYVLSRHYLYRSWVFRSLLLLPNLMCLAGGVVALHKVGSSALQNGADLRDSNGVSARDPKGAVWWYIGAILIFSFGGWILWAGVGMFVSRLFRAPWHQQDNDEEEKEAGSGKV